MGRLRKDYCLYRRRCKDGTKIWYYRTYDQYGQRTTGRSTGETNRTRAERRCNSLLRTGELVPIKEVGFEAYAAPWWIWDICPYIRGRLARSPTDRPTISRRHAADMRAALEAYILPTFRTSRLSSIRPQAIETWMFSLLDRGLSPKRINNIAGCLRVMLGEAKRLGLLTHNPFESVRPFADQSRDRGSFTVEEVRNLFALENIGKVWAGHLLHRSINMVAASTGMRQGEILALRDEDVRDGYIHVAHSWHWKYGLGPTKTRQQRDVPVPSRVLADIAPFRGSGGFVFSFTRGKTPAGGSRVTKALYESLERAGISEQERRNRNLKFHSWRIFFNSLARAHAVPTAVLQRVTGHTTPEMTEHYTTYSLEDFKEIAALQEEVFK